MLLLATITLPRSQYRKETGSRTETELKLNEAEELSRVRVGGGESF